MDLGLGLTVCGMFISLYKSPAPTKLLGCYCSRHHSQYVIYIRLAAANNNSYLSLSSGLFFFYTRLFACDVFIIISATTIYAPTIHRLEATP